MAVVGLIYCPRSEPIPRQTGPVWLEIYCHGFEAPVYSQRPVHCTVLHDVAMHCIVDCKAEQKGADQRGVIGVHFAQNCKIWRYILVAITLHDINCLHQCKHTYEQNYCLVAVQYMHYSTIESSSEILQLQCIIFTFVRLCGKAPPGQGNEL